MPRSPDAASLASIVSRKKAVLFDLFHTLTSVETACPDYPGTAKLLGLPPDLWSAQQLRNASDRLVGRVTDPVEIVRSMAHAIDPTVPEPTIRAAAAGRLEAFAGSMLRPPDESLTLLGALKGLGKRIGLVSNADASEVRQWDRSPLAPHFEFAAFSCHVGHAKPAPEIFHACLSKLGVGPSDCVFVGDGGADELAAADRLGMTPVQYTGLVRRISGAPGQPKPGAHYVIDSFAELLPRA